MVPSPSRNLSPSRTVTRALAVVLVAAVCLTLAAPAAASPRPVPVVAGGASEFQSAADRAGLPLEVTESTATVRLTEDGTARWTVRNRLPQSAADRLADDAALRREVLAELERLDGREATLAIEGRTAVVSYATRETTTRSVGVLRADLLRQASNAVRYTGLGVGELVVVGPPDTRAVHAPAGATSEGRRVTLTEYDPSGDGAFLAFAPADAPLPGVQATLAVWSALAGVVARNLLLLVAVPAALFAGACLAVARLARRVRPRWDGPPALGASDGTERVRRLGLGVATLGVVAAAHPLWVPLQPVVNDYSPLLLAGGVAYAVVGAVAAVVPDRLRLPDAVGALAGAGLAGLGAVAAVAIAFVTPAAGGRVVVLGRSAEQLAVLAPVLFMFVVGALAVRDARARRAAVAGATLVLAVAMAVRVDLASVGGTLYGLAVVLFGLAALAAPVAGAPLAALGAAAAGTSRT